jgi:hypothetical protein
MYHEWAIRGVHAGFWPENLKAEAARKTQGINGRIILKWFYINRMGYGLDSFRS